MSNGKKKRSRFTKNFNNGYSSQPISPAPAALWYTGIQELPLFKFIRIYVTGNLKELIIQGSPGMEQLISTWNAIFEEFLDGMQDKSGKQRVMDMSLLEKYKWEFELIQLCVKRLKTGWDMKLEHPTWIVDILREHIRVDGKFNPEDQDGYFRDMQAILTRSNNIQLKIKDLEARLNITGQEEKKPPTYKEWDRLIAQVSLHTGFYVDRQHVMTSEFMAFYQGMREKEEIIAMELAAAKINKAGRHH